MMTRIFSYSLILIFMSITLVADAANKTTVKTTAKTTTKVAAKTQIKKVRLGGYFILERLSER